MCDTLKRLFVHCEENRRADITQQALAMCQEDFSELHEALLSGEVWTLREPLSAMSNSSLVLTAHEAGVGLVAEAAEGTEGRSGGGDCGGQDSAGGGDGVLGSRVPEDGAAAGVETASQSPGAGGDEALLDSPAAHAQMLAQLESLDMEMLQEAAAYFDVSQVQAKGGRKGPAELLPREEHESLYLRRATAEGRERSARAFLATLSQMMLEARPSPPTAPPHTPRRATTSLWARLVLASPPPLPAKPPLSRPPNAQVATSRAGRSASASSCGIRAGGAPEEPPQRLSTFLSPPFSR